jgi:hypothetical protein
MTPESIEALKAVTKGNRSWYIRNLFLVLQRNPQLREEVEKHFSEVENERKP